MKKNTWETVSRKSPAKKKSTKSTTKKTKQTTRKKSPAKKMTKKEFFKFLEMDEIEKIEKGLIGTLIKKLGAIRKKTGGGVFIAYINKPNELQKLLKIHKEFTKVPFTKQGWYIWAYTEDAVEKAKHLILDEAEKFIENRMKYVPTVKKVKKKTFEIVRDEFPTLGDDSSVKTVSVSGWSKPLEFTEESSEGRETGESGEVYDLPIFVPRYTRDESDVEDIEDVEIEIDEDEDVGEYWDDEWFN